jgi:co-chaperonin GroES (HSP10)
MTLKLADVGAVSTGSSYAYKTLQQAFPEIESGLKPFGNRVLVQIRTPMYETKGGIVIVEEARETDKWNAQVAKVIALGPVCFKNRDTLEPWPEGDWVKPGMFVRVPKYGGDRWEVPIPGKNEHALFVLYNDLDVGGEITGDPLDVVAYIK